MAEDGSPLAENTRAAFIRGFDHGADGFETDVHRTADDALVIHHDAHAEGIGLLSERTLAEIRAARPDLPTLQETLDAGRGKRCNVEIKNMPTDADFDPDHRVVALVAELLTARAFVDDVIVSSFNLATVDAFHVRLPQTPTGWLISALMPPVPALAVVREHGLQALHPNVASLTGDVARELVEAAGEIELNVWTVNDAATVRTLRDLGYTSVITDDVAMARRALG
jgi:glycerophosphoryl diester phosphodiesterase